MCTRLLVVLVVTISTLVMAPRVAAQEPAARLSIYPHNRELILKGGRDSGLYKARLILSSSDGDAPITGVHFITRRLDNTDGTGSIAAERISVVPANSIQAAIESDSEGDDDAIASTVTTTLPLVYVVSVSFSPDVTYPEGQYEGPLLIVHDGSQTPTTVTLKLTLAPTPILKIDGPSTINVNAEAGTRIAYPLILSETGNASDARALAVKAAALVRTEGRQLSLPPATVTGPIGTRTAYTETTRSIPIPFLGWFTPRITVTESKDSAVIAPITVTRGSKQTFPLLFDFARNDIPAGAYSGKLLFSGENVDDLEVPVQITIKHGLLWPLLALISSIVLGMGIRTYTTEYQRRDKLLQEIDALKQELDPDTIDLPAGVDRSSYAKLYYAVKLRLLWAERELQRNRPGCLKVGKEILAEAEAFRDYVLLRREFHTFVSVKQRLDELLTTLAEVPSIEEYPYAKRIQKELERLNNALGEFVTSTSYDEVWQPVRQELDELPTNRLRVFIDTVSRRQELNAFLTAIKERYNGEVEQPDDLADLEERIRELDDQLRATDRRFIFEKADLKEFKAALNNVPLDHIAEELASIQEKLKMTFPDEEISPSDRTEQAGGSGQALYDSMPASTIMRHDGSTIESDVDERRGLSQRNDVQANRLLDRVSRMIRSLREWLASIRYSGYQLAVAIVTLIVLAYLGLIEIYFKNPTFGASYADYAALIGWGFAANATQEGIFQLVAGLGTGTQQAETRSRTTNSR